MKTLDRVLQRWRIKEVRPYLEPGMRVLDVGCADGSLRRHAPRLRAYVGIDPKANGPGLIRGFFPADVPELQEPFDAIVLLAVLEHVRAEDLPAFIDAARDQLVPNGVALLTVPSPFVDRVLSVLKGLHLVEGMSLEEHYGFDVSGVPELFTARGFQLETHRRFQLGLNHLFVFSRSSESSTGDYYK